MSIQYNMVVSSAGHGPESDCSGKVQKQLYEEITSPSSRQRGRPTSRKPQMLDRKQRCGHGLQMRARHRQTDRHTVGRKLTSTSTVAKRTLRKSVSPCAGGLEYLHRSPATRKKRRKRNPVPGGITGPLSSWGI
jgi:hypothetical protein